MSAAMEVQVNINLDGMWKYHETVIEGFARFIGDLADEGRDYIKSSWSAVSPSSPGMPPAVVTGFHDAGIEADKSQTKNFMAYVRGNAPYAAALEYGTHKMEARPYMRPWLHDLSPEGLVGRFQSGGYIK